MANGTPPGWWGRGNGKEVSTMSDRTVNRAKTGKQRDEKGRFIAGNHNGGRKKQPPEFRAVVLENAPDALQVLLAIMRDEDASNADRIKAANIIIERAYGKPDSTVKLETPKADMLDDIRAEMERLKASDEA